MPLRVRRFAVPLCLLAAPIAAQQPGLLPKATVAALAAELSGESAKRDLEFLTRLHRMPGSPDFHQAIAFLAGRLAAAGLAEIRVDSFPTDGKIYYGTQRSRPAWWAEFAELWELERGSTGWAPVTRLASFEAMPITLADMGESGEVEADLVDVGDGTREADYAGK